MLRVKPLKMINNYSTGQLMKFKFISSTDTCNVLVFDNSEFELKNLEYIDFFKSFKNCSIYVEKSESPDNKEVMSIHYIDEYNPNMYEDICESEDKIYKIIFSTTILSDDSSFVGYLINKRSEPTMNLADYDRYF